MICPSPFYPCSILVRSPFYPRSISISPAAVKAKAFHPVRDAVKALSSKSEDAGYVLGSPEQQGSMSMLLVGMFSIIPVYICINIYMYFKYMYCCVSSL